MLGMRQSRTPSLPKGLPHLPATPTNYLVVIATRQWRTVADSVKSLEDLLIVEGIPALHPHIHQAKPPSVMESKS